MKVTKRQTTASRRDGTTADGSGRSRMPSTALPARPARRRVAAQGRHSRAERREEVYGPAFDFLRARDVLPVILAGGAAEVVAVAQVSAVVFAPIPVLNGGIALGAAIVASMLAAGQIGVALALWSLLKVLSFFNRRMKRPVYYPQERMRRERLANERRRVRDRFTLNPCPEPKALLEQYAKAKGNAREAIRFGSMLCDLEAYCDNSLVRNDDGEIVGRNPGVRGWFRRHCPELAAHYSNAMRYKGLAEKFRQAAGVGDPVPAAPLAEPDARAAEALLGGRGCCKITVRTRKVNGVRRGEEVGREFTLDADEVATAWRHAQEILAECESATGSANNAGHESEVMHDGGAGSAVDNVAGKPRGNADSKKGTKIRTRCGSMARLMAALDKRLAPEQAPSGWRMETVATRRRIV